MKDGMLMRVISIKNSPKDFVQDTERYKENALHGLTFTAWLSVIANF